MKVKIPSIESIKMVREKIHLADVVLTSPRAQEVLGAISGILNDACFELDQVIDDAQKSKKDA